MHAAPTDRSRLIHEQLERFLAERVVPNEALARQQLRAARDPHAEPEIVRARRARRSP